MIPFFQNIQRLTRDLLCCDTRGPQRRQQVALALAGPADTQMRKLARTFDNSRTMVVIEYMSVGDDADAFDRAFETNDMRSFVELLASNQAIQSIDSPKHPWAAEPQTVGALVAAMFALLASEVGKNDPGLRAKIKDDIREAGAIPPLVDFLRSEEEDRSQQAVVALWALTIECGGTAAEVYTAGAMPMLIRCLHSEIGGLRGAAASTLREIFLENDEYRKAFVDLGGVEGLVMHLDLPPDSGSSRDSPSCGRRELELEAVSNLEDLVLDDDGNIIEEYAKCAVKFGVKERLEKLVDSSEDEEVKGSAEKVLAQLQNVDDDV